MDPIRQIALQQAVDFTAAGFRVSGPDGDMNVIQLAKLFEDYLRHGKVPGQAE